MWDYQGIHFHSEERENSREKQRYRCHRPVAFTFIILEYLKYLVRGSQQVRDCCCYRFPPIMGKVRKSFIYNLRPLDFLWSHHSKPLTIWFMRFSLWVFYFVRSILTENSLGTKINWIDLKTNLRRKVCLGVVKTSNCQKIRMLIALGIWSNNINGNVKILQVSGQLALWLWLLVQL